MNSQHRSLALPQNLPHWFGAEALLAAVLVALLTLGCIPTAHAQFNATPNGGYISFNLAAGTSSSPITLPADIPWHVNGSTTTAGDRGVGEVDLERRAGYFLQWVGINSNYSGTITQGFSSTAGTHIVQIDFIGDVNIVVNDGDSFIVTNSSSGPRTGYVTWTSYSNSINSPYNVALGNYALNTLLNSTGTTGYGNTATGYASLYEDVAGSYNTASGYYALFYNTTGVENTAVGANSLLFSTTGSYNAAVGYGALYANTTGYNNTALGTVAMQDNTTGYENTAVGDQALYSNGAGYYNTATGFQSLFYNTTGFYNTAAGFQALYHNTTGAKNFGDGVNALFSNTTGTNNTAFGVGALYNNTTGSFNIGEGYHGGYNLTTGSNNVDIDNPGVAGENGVMRFGTEGTQVQTYVAGIYGVSVSGGSPVYVNSAGQLGVVVSSERFKTAIAPMGAETEKLSQLRPVTFHLKSDPAGALQYGLIAEEVAKVYPDLVVRNADGRIDGVRYDELAPMLLNEVQQQKKVLASQAAQLQDFQEQKKVVASQAIQLQDLQRQLADMRTALLDMQGKNSRVARR